MGLLGNIPTAADLTTAGIALEDHAAAQGKALIDYAEAAAQRLVVSLNAALSGNVDNLRNDASRLPAEIGAELQSAIDRFSVIVEVLPRKVPNV